jgi:uncharacterized protein YeaO (DUF488 family)
VAGRLATQRVYERPLPNGGTRVLIMRLWPRGIRKNRVNHWFKELGPVLPLLRAFRAGTITWPQYRRRYLAGLARPAARAQVQEVRRLARAGRVTLLCGCPDAQRCHRTLLHSYLTKHRPAVRTTSARQGLR